MSLDFGKLNFSTSFNPTSAFPLDARSYFESLVDAQAAASSAKEAGDSTTKYYYGETIAVVENNVATLYIIDKESVVKEGEPTYKGVLRRVGELADGKSLNLNISNGTMSIKNYGVEYYEWDSTEKKYKESPTKSWKAGLIPRVKDIGTAGSPNLVIAWYEPNSVTVDKIGVADGVASLDNNSKVPLSQLPESILGQLLFGGTFNTECEATIRANLKTKLGISDTTIKLVNSATDNTTKSPKEYGYKTLEGVYFIAADFPDSGAAIFDGTFTIKNGNRLISTGSEWRKLENADSVITVNGKTGVVVLTASDVGVEPLTDEEVEAIFNGEEEN